MASKEIPVLSDPITPRHDTKVRTAFYVAFFNCERMREELAALGYYVPREIISTNGDEWCVKYTFKGHTGGPATNLDSVVEIISLEFNSPFTTRDVLLGKFHDLIQHFKMVRELWAHKIMRTLSERLSPEQIKELSMLTVEELAAVVRAI